MDDFSRLVANWYKWAPAMGGGMPYVTTECDDCVVAFMTKDYSVHIRFDGTWWAIDTVNDRGQRKVDDAKLSSFALTEKYLIWNWATAARSDLASGPLGAMLARQGFDHNVDVSKVDTEYKICLHEDCAILSVVDATIFSHLMAKSIEQLERIIAALAK
ncbi:hypothetical protein [Mycobacterium sp. E2462]|uniref:hypothetical protein n=1 Tax=Mycobacterium sp. E2462 TaxID=1834133 RepID=UPI000B0C87A1|nr:hypothetical protein [Mycobacterium sp. E2462]